MSEFLVVRHALSGNPMRIRVVRKSRRRLGATARNMRAAGLPDRRIARALGVSPARAAALALAAGLWGHLLADFSRELA